MRATKNKTILSVLSLLATALLLTLGLGGTPASGALGATITEVTRDGCVVYVNFTVEDAGTYALVVYDDGSIVDASSVAVQAGGSATLTHTIVAAAGTGASGIGLYLTDSTTDEGGRFDDVDPYTYPDELADTCTGEPTTTTTTTFPVVVPTTGGPGYVGSTTSTTEPTETTVPTTDTTLPTETTEPPVETTVPVTTAPATTAPTTVDPGSLPSNAPPAVGGASAARPVSGAADYTG